VGACGTGSGGGSVTTPKPTPSNGVASKPPAKILDEAKKALESATSVRMRGSIRQSGQPYSFDLVLSQKTAKGTMTAPMEGIKHASFDFVVTGGRMYIRSSTLWRKAGGAAAASLLNNRWVMLPKTSLSDFPFASTKAFTHSLESGSSGKARSVGAVTTVNGQPAIPVKTSDSIVYVATTGKPYPLRIAPSSAKDGKGVADLFGYNEPVNITVPPNPIDVTKLRG
jgi:hypothetical protein